MPSEPKGKTVEVNGVDIYYEDRGAGEPLVLLHGFFQASQVWNDCAATFAQEYRVIVVDLRYHGRSGSPEGLFTHAEAADDVWGLLDHLGVDRFSAVGFSTGGMTLLHMATARPERIRSLVLVAAQTHYSDETRERITQFTAPPELEEQLPRFHHGDEDRIEGLKRQFAAMADNYDDMAFTPARLGTISARTLVMLGDRDRFVPVRMATEMFDAIPNANLWIVPNGEHPVHLGIRELFKTTALEFLGKGSPARN